MKIFVAAAFGAAIACASLGGAYAQPDRHDDHRDEHHSAYKRHDEWHKGARIGHDDWNRGQPVDWRAHHLRAPRRGYEWREVDGNYVLAAAAGGLIGSIIANSH